MKTNFKDVEVGQEFKESFLKNDLENKVLVKIDYINPDDLPIGFNAKYKDSGKYCFIPNEYGKNAPIVVDVIKI
jgi:hypothetical protein